MANKALMTAEEYARMSTAENEDYELIDGDLAALPSATPLHNLIGGKSVQMVRNYFDKDLSIFLGEEWERLDLNQTPVPSAPTIAVVSLSEQMIDVNRKVRDYMSAGSTAVWLLEHENGELHVRKKAGIRLREGGELLDSPLLPGFEVNVAELQRGHRETGRQRG